MTLCTFTREEMEFFAATVASATAGKLVELGALEEAKAIAFTEEWSVVMIRKESVVKRLWSKLFAATEENVYLIRFVRLPGEASPQPVVPL